MSNNQVIQGAVLLTPREVQIFVNQTRHETNIENINEHVNFPPENIKNQSKINIINI